MDDAGRGVRRETVHVPRSDAERLAFELLADVLRERRLAGAGWSSDQGVIAFQILLNRPQGRGDVIDFAVSVLEFLRHELITEGTGVPDHRVGLLDSGTCMGAVRSERGAGSNLLNCLINYVKRHNVDGNLLTSENKGYNLEPIFCRVQRFICTYYSDSPPISEVSCTQRVEELYGRLEPQLVLHRTADR